MTSSKIDLSKPPKFLTILGAHDVAFDEKKELPLKGSETLKRPSYHL